MKMKDTLEEQEIERLKKAEEEEIEKEVCFFEMPPHNGKYCSHYRKGTEFTTEKGEKIFYCAKHADGIEEIRMGR